jgi:regulator of sigma E protease
VTSFLAFIFVLGVLVFIHELGHFLAARRIGVRVLTFSLGFGPKLLTVKRGDTEYCISAIPLGGYVKMAGENPDDARTGAPDEFLSKSKWERFQVLIMGPIMNLLLAVVVMALVLYQGAELPAFTEQPAVVGSVETGSPAEAAGIRPGDRIISVQGREIADWDKLTMAIGTRANRELDIVFERDGKRIEKNVTPRVIDKFETGGIGVGPWYRPEIATVSEGPARESGLKEGDLILAADGKWFVNREQIIETIKSHDGKPLDLIIDREGKQHTITVTPRQIDDGVRINAQIRATETVTVQPGIVDAFKLSVERNWEWTVLIFETLAGLFTRDTSVKQLMGPVGIASLSGDAAEAGVIPLFTLMALISLNLGIMNLMPIPVLDGGHIAILAVEGLSRRDFSIKVKEKMLLGGFVILLTLMATVIYNDLTRVQWIERLMPWR